MIRGKGETKGLALFLAALLLAGSLAGCTAAPVASSSTPVAVSSAGSAELPGVSQKNTGDEQAKNQLYLAHYFGIEAGQEWTQESYAKALAAITGEEVSVPQGDFTALSAIYAAVGAAGYEELAKTYPEVKIKDRLAEYGITSSPNEAAALACALDTGLIDAETGKLAAAGKKLEPRAMDTLLMAVASAAGAGRNYLAYSNDPQIYARLDTMWNSFVMFNDETLNEIGKTAVETGVATGYNLKDSAFDARFLPEYTLQYGHDNPKHACQLIGLLNSEGIVARVQMEPKVSVYQYLLEWGPVPDARPTYEVRKFSDDLYLVFSVEYDLQLEFNTEQEMMRFDAVVKEYAKKNEGNEEAAGLIYSSWWQPLYSTTREGMPADDYKLIYDCVIQNGGYSIHPFCLPENLDKTTEALKKLGAEDLQPVARYCNTAFYNYLTGDDYQ